MNHGSGGDGQFLPNVRRARRYSDLLDSVGSRDAGEDFREGW